MKTKLSDVVEAGQDEDWYRIEIKLLRGHNGMFGFCLALGRFKETLQYQRNFTVSVTLGKKHHHETTLITVSSY